MRSDLDTDTEPAPVGDADVAAALATALPRGLSRARARELSANLRRWVDAQPPGTAAADRAHARDLLAAADFLDAEAAQARRRRH